MRFPNHDLNKQKRVARASYHPILSLRRASCRIRTNDPEITNHVLWPTELKRQCQFSPQLEAFSLQFRPVCGCKVTNLFRHTKTFYTFFRKKIHHTKKIPSSMTCSPITKQRSRLIKHLTIKANNQAFARQNSLVINSTSHIHHRPNP